MRLLGRLFFIIRKFRKKKQLLRSDLGMYDVIIIGAGVSGAATARELSRPLQHRFQIPVLVHSGNAHKGSAGQIMGYGPF